MKKIILVLSIVLSGIIAVNAQAKKETTKTTEQKVADKVAGYKRNCNLTETQVSQVKSLVENYYKKEDDITAEYSKKKNNKESVDARAANQTALDQQVEAILNPDQKAKFEAYLTSEKEKATKAAEKKK